MAKTDGRRGVCAALGSPNQYGDATPDRYDGSRERRIFEARRLAEEPITLSELADEFGVSRERVRQISERAFEKVQNVVKQRVAAMGTPAPLQVR